MALRTSVLLVAALLPQAGLAQEPKHLTTLGPYVGIHGSSVSPDGHHLAHTDWTTGDLAITDLRTGTTRRVTNKGPLRRVLEFAESFTRFSSDGRKLAYIWDKNGYDLRLIGTDGTGERLIYPETPVHTEMAAFDWSTDGHFVAALVPRRAGSRDLQLALIAMGDGSVRPLKDVAPGEQPRSARFAPDGRTLAYEYFPKGASTAQIALMRLDDRVETKLHASPANARLLGWTPDGAGLWVVGEGDGRPAVWFQAMKAGVPVGPARLIAGDIPADLQPLGFAADGTYYFARYTQSQHEVYTASLDLARGTVSEVAKVPTSRKGNSAPDWSPDGRSLAYVHAARTVVIHSLDRKDERVVAPKGIVRIFTVASGHPYARWSPDGGKLLVPQNRVVFTMDPGSGETTPMLTDRRSRYGRWSRDGTAAYHSRQVGLNDAPFQIVKNTLGTNAREVLYTSNLPGDNVWSLEVSPDEGWLAFSDIVLDAATDREHDVIRLLPKAGGTSRVLVKGAPDEDLRVVGWTPDAREVLFTRDQKRAWKRSPRVWRIGLDGGEARAIDLGLNVGTALRFHPDGRRVAFDTGPIGAEIWTIAPR